MATTIVPVHTTENKITGCPEYTVEINSSTAKCMTTQEYNQYISSWSDNMKEYAEYIREKTIDECIAWVPDDGKNVTFSGKNMNQSGIGAWNWCREQTITNLNNLKNNE